LNLKSKLLRSLWKIKSKSISKRMVVLILNQTISNSMQPTYASKTINTKLPDENWLRSNVSLRFCRGRSQIFVDKLVTLMSSWLNWSKIKVSRVTHRSNNKFKMHLNKRSKWINSKERVFKKSINWLHKYKMRSARRRLYLHLRSSNLESIRTSIFHWKKNMLGKSVYSITKSKIKRWFLVILEKRLTICSVIILLLRLSSILLILWATLIQQSSKEYAMKLST